jgi:tetratricopeptide (TPR) repeat protein
MPIFRRSKKEKKEPVEELLNAVQKFVSAPTMEESRRILEDNQDLLFSDAAEFVINKLIADFEGDDQVTMVLERHRDLLALCKYEGIDSAFRSQTPTRRPASPKNYYQLYSEGLRNIQQGNIEAAIKLLDQALDEMGFLAGDSELWASAHHNLGEAYRMRSKGSKAANLEKCLEHYQMALNEGMPGGLGQDQ